MEINVILVLVVIVAAITTAIWIELRKRVKRSRKEMSLKVVLPCNLPIITLYCRNGRMLSFLLDSGSNMSHICPESVKELEANVLGTYKEGKVTGLGAENVGITMCEATLFDSSKNSYKVNLSISEQLTAVADSLESSSGIRIDGLLGTDFLNPYGCVIDFDDLNVLLKKNSNKEGK